jgi:hypothetical protein
MMAIDIYWEVRQRRCADAECVANLLLEWRDLQGRSVLTGVSCDNPRLRDLDNWDCSGSCWEEIADEAEQES